jgi:hypothetical protein
MKLDSLLSGIFWIIIGILILGVNSHWWTADIWYQLLAIWPLILVIVGIRLIFGDKNPVSFFLCIVCILLGFVFVTNSFGLREKYISAPTTQEQSTSKLLGDYKEAKILLNIGAADVKISSLARSSFNLYDFTYVSEAGMTVNDKSFGDIADVTLSEKESSTFYRFNKRSLDLKLSTAIPTNLTVNSGATNLDFDLSDILITDLGISCGASSGKIKIGDRSNKVNISLSTGASDFKILLPKNYSIWIESKVALTSESYGSLGLEKNGQSYKSKDFDTSKNQIKVTINAGVSSFDITTY